MRFTLTYSGKRTAIEAESVGEAITTAARELWSYHFRTGRLIGNGEEWALMFTPSVGWAARWAPPIHEASECDGLCIAHR